MSLLPVSSLAQTGSDPETENGFQELSQRAEAFLEQWRQSDRLRTLVTTDPSADYPLDFTHNDYLSLRNDDVFQKRAHQHAANLPVGGGASRLLGGEHGIFRELENGFARFKGAPEALYFASGYAANEACAASLARFGGRIFSDSLNHASIIDGVRLSGLSKQDRVIFPHRDLACLESELARSNAPYNLILSESLYSMDGDRADLLALADLARRFRGVLVIDEAHAIGCMGPGGAGLVPAAGLDQSQVITVNTCGKALGVQGALVCGPAWFRDLLINTARPFIYTTAPSPWLAAALLTSLLYLQDLEPRRQWLAAASGRLRKRLKELGFDTGETCSHIIPVLCGSDRAALRLSKSLLEQGVLARAIRPPTVPEGTSRVRLSLFSGLGEDGLETLMNAFEKAASDHAP